MTKPAKKLLALRGARALGDALEKEVRHRLDGRSVPKALDDKLGKRPSKMPHAEYWGFRVLHRQFSGRSVPGLSTLVQAARAVVKRVKTRSGQP